MQQYLKTGEVSYNAIFYSAFKSLLVFDLLLQSPKTFAQIQLHLSKLPYINANISQDTLRVYINSFKKAGCVVEKKLTGEKRREYAYFIPENPFCLKITSAQIKSLFEIYDMIMYNLPFDDFLKVDLLIRRFTENIKNEEFLKTYEEHSFLNGANMELLLTLQQCCKEGAQVTVLYNSPQSGKKEIPIITKRMIFKNYKLYLEGFGREYNEDAIFLFERIVKLVEVIPAEEIDTPECLYFDVEFELFNKNIPLLDNEKIKEQKGGKLKVVHKSSNKKMSMQRFLQLGQNAKIISPQEFKNEFISTLKATKEVYANGK